MSAAINFRPQLLINILETHAASHAERFKERKTKSGPENESKTVRLSSLVQREIYCDSWFNCIEKSAIHLVGGVHLNEATRGVTAHVKSQRIQLAAGALHECPLHKSPARIFHTYPSERSFILYLGSASSLSELNQKRSQIMIIDPREMLSGAELFIITTRGHHVVF